MPVIFWIIMPPMVFFAVFGACAMGEILIENNFYKSLEKAKCKINP